MKGMSWYNRIIELFLQENIFFCLILQTTNKYSLVHTKDITNIFFHAVFVPAEASEGVGEAVQASAGQEQANDKEERRLDDDHPEAGGQTEEPGQGEPGDG